MHSKNDGTAKVSTPDDHRPICASSQYCRLLCLHHLPLRHSQPFSFHHHPTSSLTETAVSRALECIQKTHFGDWFLLTTNKTEKGAKHTKQSEQSAKESSTRLRVCLESQYRVKFREFNKSEHSVADKAHRVLLEGRCLL